METQQYNTFKFIRRYFNLPSKTPLEWCIVMETTRSGSECRLGIKLKGTRHYIDVAMRRFLSEIDIPLIGRTCHSAKRIDRKDGYEYRSEEGLILRKPKHYIRDIYASSWYDRETFGQTWL